MGCVMSKLRDALLAAVLATGVVGCATFCDECDDFPNPGGPGSYSMAPGSYTGPPLNRVPGPAPMAGTETGPAMSPEQIAPETVTPPAPVAPESPAVPPPGGGAEEMDTRPGAAPAPTPAPAAPAPAPAPAADADPTTSVSTSEAPAEVPPASPGGGLSVPPVEAPDRPQLP
jgi:hypothetical protein